jgi:hypothetical protein
MPARRGCVHVATTKRVYKGKTYVTQLRRRSICTGSTVTHEALGNVSHLIAVDRLLQRHGAIEKKLAQRHLGAGPKRRLTWA